jgi:hypothetical protein
MWRNSARRGEHLTARSAPMQGGASFNMSAVKEQIEKAIAARSTSK